jgi:thiol-disulfide isomerase/thioredoxin
MPSNGRLGLATIVMLVAACHRGPKVPEGDILASLTVPNLAGDPLDTASLAGKRTLLLFVTPSCTHCLATIPHAIEAARERDANVAAVFVAGDRDRAQRVVDQLKFPGPALFDDGTLRKLYKVDSVPYTLVVGKDGKATDAFEGEQSTVTLADALAN